VSTEIFLVPSEGVRP